MKPILFNIEMVRAILEGRKTVTRRPIKPQPVKVIPWYNSKKIHEIIVTPSGETLKGILYRTGDILYVRETWCDPSGTGYPIFYRADMPMHWDAEDTEIGVQVDMKAEDYKWHPSIHMPREASRIFLRVTDVRAERLQDISEHQAKMEGTALPLEQQYDPEYAEYKGGYYNAFSELWDSTIKKVDRALYGWDANPWVWVIEFERISRDEETKC